MPLCRAGPRHARHGAEEKRVGHLVVLGLAVAEHGDNLLAGEQRRLVHAAPQRHRLAVLLRPRLDLRALRRAQILIAPKRLRERASSSRRSRALTPLRACPSMRVRNLPARSPWRHDVVHHLPAGVVHHHRAHQHRDVVPHVLDRVVDVGRTTFQFAPDSPGTGAPAGAYGELSVDCAHRHDGKAHRDLGSTSLAPPRR